MLKTLIIHADFFAMKCTIMQISIHMKVTKRTYSTLGVFRIPTQFPKEQLMSCALICGAGVSDNISGCKVDPYLPVQKP